MRLVAAASLFGVALLSYPATVHAQAAAEYGLAVGNATGMSGAASGIGKALSGLAGTLDKTVQSQPASTSSTPSIQSKSTAARKSPATAKVAAVPAPVYEDLKNLEAGMAYTDVVRRFGPPSMEFASATGKSLTYANRDGMTQVEVRNEAVASISRPSSAAAAEK